MRASDVRRLPASAHALERLPMDRPGVVQLGSLGPLVDPRSDSLPEATLRLRWVDAGLPKPECQVPVPSPSGGFYLVDVGLPDEAFGAEYFGERCHGEDRR